MPCPSAIILLAVAVLLLAGGSGCDRGASRDPATPRPPAASEAEPLRIAVIDDPQLAEGIESEWQVRGDAPITMHAVSSDQLRPDGRIPADVVVYPSGMLGTLVQNETIVPLERSLMNDPQLALGDVLELLRLREISWDRHAYGVSLGSPQLMLMYRQDIFQELGLAVPRNWTEYSEVVQALNQYVADGSRTTTEPQPEGEEAGEQGEAAKPVLKAAVAEPLGDGWASTSLVARAVTYVAEDDQSSFFFDWASMKPRIVSPAFVQALEDQARDARANGDFRVATPHEARRALLEGRVALAWSWPSGATQPGARVAGTIGLARLPGATRTYHQRGARWTEQPAEDPRRPPLLAVAGRMASLARNPRQKSAAESMLIWLGGKQLGAQFASHSPDTAPFRYSQLAQLGPWLNRSLASSTGPAYAEVLRETFSRGRAVVMLRIPGRDRYLAALDQAVRQTIAGQASAEQSLEEALARWESITDEIGRDAQQASYEASVEL